MKVLQEKVKCLEKKHRFQHLKKAKPQARVTQVDKSFFEHTICNMFYDFHVVEKR
jgi:hypothetical protein